MNSVVTGLIECDHAQVLVLGGEHGVSKEVIPMLDTLIEVENPNGQYPLNVFVGASIVLWEYAQQHRPLSRPIGIKDP